MRTTSAAAAAVTSVRAPALVVASGFSTRTFPALMAASASGTCVLGGVATTTASTCSRAGQGRGDSRRPCSSG